MSLSQGDQHSLGVSHFSHTEGSMQCAPEAQASWLWFSKMFHVQYPSPGSASLVGAPGRVLGGGGWSQKAFCKERTSFKWTFLQDDPWAGKVEGGVFQNHSPVSTIELLLDGLPWFLGSR